jgi:hypothetical protein
MRWGRRLIALAIAIVIAPLTLLILSLFTGFGAVIVLLFLFGWVPAVAVALATVGLPGMLLIDVTKVRGAIPALLLGAAVGAGTVFWYPWIPGNRRLSVESVVPWLSFALALYGTYLFGVFERWVASRQRTRT